MRQDVRFLGDDRLSVEVYNWKELWKKAGYESFWLLVDKFYIYQPIQLEVLKEEVETYLDSLSE